VKGPPHIFNLEKLNNIKHQKIPADHINTYFLVKVPRKVPRKIITKLL